MTNLTNTPTWNTLGRRVSCVAVGVFAAAALMVSADSASAAAKELNALKAELSKVGATVDTATAAQLATAVKTIISAPGNNFKVGIVAGEALKTTAAKTKDAGAAIGQAIVEGAPSVDRGEVLGTATKTASTPARTGSIEEVRGFALSLIPAAFAGANDEAIQAALLAKTSKLGAAAIIGARASQLADDAAKTSFASSVLGQKVLKAATLEISEALARSVTNVSTFASAVAAGNAAFSTTQVAQIAQGATRALPTSAGAIASAFLTPGSALANKLVNSVVPTAKVIAFSAAIEQITLVADAAAKSLTATKVTQAALLAKTMAQAILTAGSTNPTVNRQDEIAEVAAFIVHGILPALGSKNATQIAAIINNIAKFSVLGGKSRTVVLSKTGSKSYIADILGSVSLTIFNSSLSADVKSKVRSTLERGASGFGGAAEKTTVLTAISEGFSGNTRYEDGNIPALANAEAAETDIRPI
jgi:hypothetical protein